LNRAPLFSGEIQDNVISIVEKLPWESFGVTPGTVTKNKGNVAFWQMAASPGLATISFVVEINSSTNFFSFFSYDQNLPRKFFWKNWQKLFLNNFSKLYENSKQEISLTSAQNKNKRYFCDLCDNCANIKIETIFDGSMSS
jgi:hypothetical protein